MVAFSFHFHFIFTSFLFVYCQIIENDIENDPKMATMNDPNYTYFNSNRYMKNFGSLRHTAYKRYNSNHYYGCLDFGTLAESLSG